ncbi:DNA damage-inducible protein 1 [Strigomonas culicis]|uniref:DNA damage-inducible protein 1 n=1 Tax=Strigomonas culicis TaxID=28005 RepID=S9UNU9_9TRYP|nr:DNA damage-inducible protein 1 [Strigomonas culicis]|eukprot:EPY30424.1 DNA damage-inducible protein 1 [Strigomonas culicis]
MARGTATLASCGLQDNTTVAVEVRQREPGSENQSKKSKEEVAPVPRRSSEAMLDYLEGDAKLQQMLYEKIQQQNIQDSLEAALEFNPEAFARVVMLYVPCEINQTPMKAFIDTGAQVSIISAEAAERCGIMRLLDRRMRGIAVGVGQQEILGRVHATLVNLGGTFISLSFSVLKESSIDVIIGLDQLKRHAMCVDLRRNVLQIEDMSVPFLPESEIPHKREKALEALSQPSEEGQGGEQPQAAPPTSGSGALTEVQQAAVQQVRDFIGTDVPVEHAVALLAAANWDVEAAVELFMSD